MSDADMVARLIENDEAMVSYVFYDHYSDLLRLNAMKATAGKNVELDDLIQELYLYMSDNEWEKLKRYDSSQPFVAWFSVVSYRFFKNFSRSMIDSCNQVSIYSMKDHQTLQSGNGILSSIMMDVRDAIARLWPPRDREILEALLLREEEPAEVARQFGVTVDNLYNIKRRALLKLIKNHLKEYVR